MNIIQNLLDIKLIDNVLCYVSSYKANYTPLVNAVETKTNLSIDKSDAGKYLRVSSLADIEMTISDIDVRIGTSITIEQQSTGIITIIGDGATVNGDPKTGGQYKCIQLIKVDTKEWILIGGVA